MRDCSVILDWINRKKQKSMKIWYNVPISKRAEFFILFVNSSGNESEKIEREEHGTWN